MLLENVLIIVSWILHLLLCAVIVPYISNYHKSYRQLNQDQKRHWCMRWTSNFHAVIVTAGGIAIVIAVTAYYPVEEYTTWFGLLGRINIAWSNGYLLHDFVWMAIYKRATEATPLAFVHHVVAFAAFYCSLYFAKLIYYSNFRIITEFSTPFVNFRWMLSVLKKKDTNLYYYNGIIMTASFFLFRIVLGILVWISISYLFQTEEYWANVTTFIHVAWMTFSVLMDLLNIVWMYKIVRGILSYKNKRNHVGNAIIQNECSDELNLCSSDSLA